ncbi:MAG: hypothetical protein AAFR38_00910 [Planctomycetota bacterium]
MDLMGAQQKMLEQLKQGQFVEGMEEFYADDAVNEEASGARTEGKAAIIANEHKVLENVAAYHGCTVHSVGTQDNGDGSGVTFAEYELKVDMKDGTTFNPKQVQVNYWRGGKIKIARFYYDPAKL